VFTIVVLAILAFAPGTAAAATAATLGAALRYGVLAGSQVTNTGSTMITGNLGISPSIGGPPHYHGFPPGSVTGAIHDADSNAAAAQAADTAAFGFIDQGCDTTYTGVQDLVGFNLVPGVYCADAFALSGTLTLSGSGVWIFKSDSSLTTSGTANVVGGDGCSVWWRVVSSATLGTNTELTGNVLALTSITLNTGASLVGRALAQTGEVKMDNNVVNITGCGSVPLGIPEFSNATIAFALGAAALLGLQLSRRTTKKSLNATASQSTASL
jgi:hypothetical protein